VTPIRNYSPGLAAVRGLRIGLEYSGISDIRIGKYDLVDRLGGPVAVLVQVLPAKEVIQVIYEWLEMHQDISKNRMQAAMRKADNEISIWSQPGVKQKLFNLIIAGETSPAISLKVDSWLIIGRPPADPGSPAHLGPPEGRIYSSLEQIPKPCRVKSRPFSRRITKLSL
jgi:hypothetical protein